jgi:hypothetical protein
MPASHCRAGTSSALMNPRKFRLEPSTLIRGTARDKGRRAHADLDKLDALRWVREFFTADSSSAD